MNDLTAERLRALLHYDPETGVFTWRPGRPRVADGATAGTVDGGGYIRIRIDGRKYAAHRLALLYVNGRWPPADTDHVNGDRTDNRTANLREATTSENMQNVRLARAGNLSGFLGVTKAGRRWTSEIRVHGRRIYLGCFATPEQAHAAYVEAKRIHHPFSQL